MVVIHRHTALRVALLAGELVQHGAEKQLVYMARALQALGVDVRIYSLTKGEFYEAELTRIGLAPHWIGRYGNPLARVAAFSTALCSFRPHIVQAGHFYTNLYVGLSARTSGAISIGALRSDALSEVAANGRWGKLLLRLPHTLLANSAVARQNAILLGAHPDRIMVLPNVIDLPDFDQQMARRSIQSIPIAPPIAAVVARLYPEKRLERFLEALALARQTVDLRGLLIGSGPELAALQAQAGQLGLLPDGVVFAGYCTDVPAMLHQVQMLVLCSDHEGFPNVLLEGMLASLPVITTPAGDAGTVVQDGITGYVVPFTDIAGMADRMVQLVQSPEIGQQFGRAGRQRAVHEYGFDGLGERLIAIYRSLAQQQAHRAALACLPKI
jgi:glycosyltransferase involved in cell wall biosynthesis